jgi:hypothetical protein
MKCVATCYTDRFIRKHVTVESISWCESRRQRDVMWGRKHTGERHLASKNRLAHLYLGVCVCVSENQI